MATLSIVFCTTSNVKDLAALPVASNVEAEAITTSATSQSSTNSANDNSRVVRLAVSGGDVWIKIAPTPTAASGTDFLLIDGDTEYFAVNALDKVAVVDA